MRHMSHFRVKPRHRHGHVNDDVMDYARYAAIVPRPSMRVFVHSGDGDSDNDNDDDVAGDADDGEESYLKCDVDKDALGWTWTAHDVRTTTRAPGRPPQECQQAVMQNGMIRSLPNPAKTDPKALPCRQATETGDFGE